MTDPVNSSIPPQNEYQPKNAVRRNVWGGLATCLIFNFAQVDNLRHFEFCKTLFRGKGRQGHEVCA